MVLLRPIEHVRNTRNLLFKLKKKEKLQRREEEKLALRLIVQKQKSNYRRASVMRPFLFPVI